MSSVGPQLPPHLSKRKRSPSDPDPPSSPPHKVVARSLGPALPPAQNPDEVNLEESSEDEYGPSIPSLKATSNSKSTVVGPTLPAKNPDEVVLDDSEEDDEYGPSISTVKTQTQEQKKRILGPALPPASLAERPSYPPNTNREDDSSSDDDDYGPSLPPAAGSYAETQYLEEVRVREEAERVSEAAPPKQQRAEWMIVPPTSDDWTSRVDPTKLKNRKFASGKGAKGPAEKGGISAIWTETPEEKRRRLEDEVLGRKEKASSERKGGKGEGGGESKEDREISRRIREMRGRSLVEVHGEGEGNGKEREKEDDPSKRGFDREKDMALGGRLGHGEKKEMLAKAKDFGSRFQRGKFL